MLLMIDEDQIYQRWWHVDAHIFFVSLKLAAAKKYCNLFVFFSELLQNQKFDCLGKIATDVIWNTEEKKIKNWRLGWVTFVNPG